MPSDGLQSTGFIPRSLATILSNMQAKQLAGISPSLNLSAPDPLAIDTNIKAAALAEVWQLVLAIYSGMSADTATGDQLTSLSLLSGTQRSGATKAFVGGCTCNVNTGFSQAPGTMFATQQGNPSVLFTNVGTAAYAGGGSANITVDFQAVNAGATGTITIGSLIVIATPLSGWNSITNGSLGVPGTDAQTDPALRVSRSAGLAASGTTTAGAIKAAILKILQPSPTGASLSFPGVGFVYTVTYPTLTATVLYNDSNVTDGNGLPAHTVEAIAYNLHSAADADDRALCALLLSYKASGIGTYSGNATSKSTTDSQGNVITVYYTRPTEVPTNVAITVLWLPGVTANPTAIQEAIALYAQGTTYAGVLVPGAVGVWAPGVTAYQTAVIGAAFTVFGVASVTVCTLSVANVGNDVVPADVRHVVTLGTIAVS